MIEPLSGAMAPAIMLNSVVLPAPFGPMTAKISPCGTAKLTRSTATRPRKRLLTLSRVRSAVICRPCHTKPARQRRPYAVRQHDDHDQQAHAVEHLRRPRQIDAQRRHRGVSASASPVSTNAPRIGPNSVPMPPMIGPRMISIEREMLNTCSGNRLL